MAGYRDRWFARASWLLDSPATVPETMATQLKNGLFSSVPIFLGGVLNTSAVAAVAAVRHPTWPFITWLVFEIVLGAIRLAVLISGRRAIEAGRTPPRILAAVLSCIWAASVGAGTFICITSGDWVLAAIACLSAAAMICGMCLRNFGTPRLAAAMILAAIIPCAVAGLFTSEPIMVIISVQLPIFLMTILSASFGLHHMMVSRMTALSELERSKSLNETILRSSPDHMLILDQDHRIVFCKRPGDEATDEDSLLDRDWLSLLSPGDVSVGRDALKRAASGHSVSIVTSHFPVGGEKRWFDNIINRISDTPGDASERLIVVSRDVTHQKNSEQDAIWMARHDPLTGLPNRALLQERLDILLDEGGRGVPTALLIVDVDNFKTINDTFGHDAGDAVLCTVAKRLSDAVDHSDFVSRTGGDEFALLVKAHCDQDVMDIAERIFDHLHIPISHWSRQLDCGASIGASFIQRDGIDRSEVMKAADMALYAAKSGGRGRMRIFEPTMMFEVERHQAMIAAARCALQRDAVEPYYQPKVSLRSTEIVGFEALLRWRDLDGSLRTPEGIEAAFEDPALSALLSERCL